MTEAERLAEIDEFEVLARYWLKHYVVRDICGLCGNTGIIDTKGVRSPRGVEVGGLFHCVCPNGQTLRRNGFELR